MSAGVGAGRLALATAVLVLGACGARDAPAAGVPAPPPAAPIDAGLVAVAAPPPGLRLPDTVTPLAYDLRLELDPAQVQFRGHVEIRVRVAQPTDVIWLHADGLAIARASFHQGARTGAVTTPPGDRATSTGVRALRLAWPVVGELTLALDYDGQATGDQEGLFRQQARGRWYLYSQAEALFARRILPCFDEPRFKAAWRVTLVVPADAVALGNAPTARERVLPDGRREVTLAEIGPLPTYLFALAVGPFELVDAGRVGRAGIPLRIAVTHGQTARAQLAALVTPKLVTALEGYLDLEMPWPKLDLVEVPRLFGAMEQVGLITFDATALLGDPDDAVFTRRFVRVASHELAHQWFGNSVTPAWWDDLWLAEAFASFLADEIALQEDGFDDPVLRLHLAREHALAADAEPGAQPLRRPIRAEPDVELAFDAIAYDKGAAVLAMFEQFAGAPAFRAALRTYLQDHAHGTATSADLVGALAQQTTPATGEALASYLDRVGTPVVELAMRCAPTPVVIAHARDGALVPVCVRYAPATARGTPVRTCAVAGARTELPLAGCPAWITGNADGAGYYATSWVRATSTAASVPVRSLTPGERIVAGDDVAAAIRRGELTSVPALVALHALAASRDPYAVVGALAIARAIDPLVDDARRARWSAWLAVQLADRLTPAAVFAAEAPAAREIRAQVLDLVPGDRFAPATLARARRLVARLTATTDPSPDLALALALAAPRGGRALFERLRAVIHATTDRELADLLLEACGGFGPALAPDVVDLALDEPTRGRAASRAVVALLERPATRTAAWRAIRDRWSKLRATLPPAEVRQLVAATAGLCEPGARAEVAATLTPGIGDVLDGPATLQAALVAIDRCIDNRSKFGDLGPALAL